MGITVRNDPIRGKVARIHTPDPDAYVKLCNEINALFVVVDVSSFLLTTGDDC
jgi:hypothetical protein